ncbi:unnamed protein product, partial [Staurois parvus]
MSLFDIFKFPASSVTVRPDVAGNRTRKTDAGIGRRTWPETLQGGHHGSAGQGKRRTDPGATLHCIPECSSGVTACGAETLPRATLGNTTREVN